MVRLFNIYHPSRALILVCSEALLTLVCFGSAFFLLQGSSLHSAVNRLAGVGQLAVMAGVCLICLYYFDLYDFRNIGNSKELLARLLQVLGAAALLLAPIYYLFPGLVVVPGLYLLASPVLLALVFGLRIALARLNQLPTGGEQAILLGSGLLGYELVREIHTRPELGIKLVGYVDDGQSETHSSPLLPRLGSAGELEEIVSKCQAHVAIVALQDRRGHLPVDSLLKLRLQGMKVLEAHTVYERIFGKIPVEDMLPSWLIFSDGFRIHRRMLAFQRAYSFVLAGLALLVALPVMAAVALLIRLDSEGPILLRQERVGRNDVRFTLYKLRSMKNDAEAGTGAVWAAAQDPRITRVGRFLRKFRLDELPQLWNVLRGDMNLIGPRPERPEFVHLLCGQIPYYQHRHIVRPGITGWAQVRYSYGSTFEEQYEKLRYDLFYIKNISPSFDLYILLQTVKIILWGRGAK